MSDLRIEGVGVRLGGRDVLRDVDLHVPRGRFVGLLGPNGSGKTSLLRTVYRRLRPATGRVLVGDTDLWRARPREAARLVAATTQDPGAAPETSALETVMLGRLPHRRGLGVGDPDAERRLAVAALERVGALDLVGRPLGRLSGGQRQRVLLARMLVQDGRVVVLDEPTNHLDVAHQLELMTLARGLAHDEGRVVVAALHDLTLAAAYCDEVVLLEAGHLVAHGPAGDVLRPDTIRAVFGVHADLVDVPGRRPLLDLRVLDPSTAAPTPHPWKALP